MYTIEGNVYSAKAMEALEEATLVKLDTTTEGQVMQATAATDEVIWVATINANAWQSVSIQESGIARVKLGGTVAIWDKLTATTWGVAIATTTAWNLSFGIALQNGTTGNYIAVLLRRTKV